MTNYIEDFNIHFENNFKYKNDFPVKKGEIIYVYTFENLYKVKVKSLKIDYTQSFKTFIVECETYENLNPLYAENLQLENQEKRIMDDNLLYCYANSNYISKDLSTLKKFIISHLFYVNSIYLSEITYELDENERILNYIKDSTKSLKMILAQEDCTNKYIKNRIKWVNENNRLLKFLIN